MQQERTYHGFGKMNPNMHYSEFNKQYNRTRGRNKRTKSYTSTKLRRGRNRSCQTKQKLFGTMYNQVYGCGERYHTPTLRFLKGVLKNSNSEQVIRNLTAQKKINDQKRLSRNATMNRMTKKKKCKTSQGFTKDPQVKQLPKIGLQKQQSQECQKQERKYSQQERNLQKLIDDEKKSYKKQRLAGKQLIKKRFAEKYINDNRFFAELMEKSLGVRSSAARTCPWNQVEIKFRDGMKSLYQQDFQNRKNVRQQPIHKSGQTARFTSPMILKTEYTDFYKPYRVQHKSHGQDEKKTLVQLPHVDSSHYQRTFIGFGQNIVPQFKYPQKVTVIPNIKQAAKSTYEREFNMTSRQPKEKEIKTLKNVNCLNKKSPITANIPFMQETTNGFYLKPYKVTGKRRNLKPNLSKLDGFTFKGQFQTLASTSYNQKQHTQHREKFWIKQTKKLSEQDPGHSQANVVNHAAPF